MNRTMIVRTIIVVTVVIVAYFAMVGWDVLTTDRVMAEVEQLGTVRIVDCVVTEAYKDNTIVLLDTIDNNYYTINDDRYNKGDTVRVWLADSTTPNTVEDDVVIDTMLVRAQ